MAGRLRLWWHLMWWRTTAPLRWMRAAARFCWRAFQDAEAARLHRKISQLESQLAIAEDDRERLLEIVRRERERVAYETAHWARRKQEMEDGEPRTLPRDMRVI